MKLTINIPEYEKTFFLRCTIPYSSSHISIFLYCRFGCKNSIYCKNYLT